MRTITLNNIVMTRVWVLGRLGESCKSNRDCGRPCVNETCVCASYATAVTQTSMFGRTTTKCVGTAGGKGFDKDGKLLVRRVRALIRTVSALIRTVSY